VSKLIFGWLSVEAVLLDLEVDVVRAENTGQFVGVSSGLVRLAVQQVLAELGLQATGERDHALGVPGDLSQIDRRLAALITLEKAARGELDQVPVPGRRGGQQRQVVPVKAPRGPAEVVIDDIDLAAEDRLDPVLAAGCGQLDRAVHHAVVGQAECGLAKRRGALGQRVDLARPIEQRVLRVDV
jgi:hypothetical protein